MAITPLGASTANPAAPPVLGEDRHVQSVFSEVLAAVGREGYASAAEVDDEGPLGESLEAAWDGWFNVNQVTRYSQVDSPEKLKHDFGEILVRAHAEGGYADPKGFLSRLTSDELATVQQVQHLADPIGVDGLSEEGALNLLLPPAAQVDMNHDGLTRSGEAWGIRFPSSTTPADVTAAWDEATAGMDLGERMTYELQMVVDVLFANFELDSEGRYVGHTEPGEPGFRNPMAEPGYSYAEKSQRMLEYLDLFKEQMAPERYERDTAFWSNFERLLEQRGAA
ncbi:hypothetical protein Mal64_22090 [Pseudobythopirellula maris]|uniref:Uncharacterized protein n=1 Tax=Pseudobythopirellula maris TaxID=2527991 RepID=A0A5C5ZPL3_9BACT|nr:hypothetical protein [Pseudobythopirellula maris]TWT88721.1 hypothetical protein Mal64_22090 [Pseudobythopirellula maris]